MVIGLIFAVIITLGHFLSEFVCMTFKHHRKGLLSFAAGISLSYLILVLFKEVYSGARTFENISHLFLLGGFVIFYIFEYHAYRHTRASIVARELKEFHSIAFFIYYFVIGIVLVSVSKENVISGLLLFIPIFLHSLISEVSMSNLHSDIKNSLFVKFILALSSILGGLLAYFVSLTVGVVQILLGFVVGALLYIVIRDSIPREDQGNMTYFVLGVVSYGFLIFLILFLV